ncbi:HAD hydrolase-like protein [Yinghuangia seranimata]|uniref:HAD hydrolase-like protein n=1 Tax=Yinghuangia seranimata TaxID=408067 RepID=UPI00248C39BB|nr:HAD hydrolase-like protein [Yinghuangia seranimata]MDI2126062.1 haloacid dehalogenase-like hydrolase [Yinghuangia seranimata]
MPHASATPQPAAPVLVLWDLDGTLVKAGHASRDAHAEAFRAVTGRTLTAHVPFEGSTDLLIARDTLTAHGIDPTDDLVAALTAALGAGIVDRADQIRREGVALPGAVAAVRELDRAAHVVQSVLTGNTAGPARVKLSMCGLPTDLLRLDLGAYGDDHAHRPALVPIARHRAAAVYGTDFPGRRTVLIGDTVRDVEAALDNNAAVLAVATGNTPPATLQAAGAHAVLPDLSDTAAFLDAVLTLTRPEPDDEAAA